MTYKQRYEGKRWEILFSAENTMERHALAQVQATLQRHLPYVIALRSAEQGLPPEGVHVVAMGTLTCPLINDLLRRYSLKIPDGKEAYTLASVGALEPGEDRLIVLAGSDSRGLLYGAADMGVELANRITGEKPQERREQLDGLRGFARTERPLIANRGIWTWGYVIYDYRRFIDNLARLRMNMLTIWNDCPPVNARDVIDYAHSRGVRVLLGFHWGWGLEGMNICQAADRARIKELVLQEYRANYRGLGMDGIYFQTLTEHHATSSDGLTTAKAACLLINDTARELLADEPDLYIQFGLHATSILDNYTDLADLDERVVIVWEDAGVIPFAYDAVTDPADATPAPPPTIPTPKDTIDYARRIAAFRPGCEFAMVPKGWMYLRWQDEFEHHGQFILGQRDPAFITERLAQRQRRWDQVNALWMRNYPLAAEFYRAILNDKPSRTTVTGLVEDGMLEEAIQPSVALFAEMIWNPCQALPELLQRALSPYYKLWT